jgi:hypothetical protein
LLAIPSYYLNVSWVSSHSYYISALLLPPTAILCFPYILETQHMPPPILQCLPSYWLPPYIIQPNSPSDLHFFAHHKLEAASSYKPLVTYYQSTNNHTPYTAIFISNAVKSWTHISNFTLPTSCGALNVSLSFTLFAIFMTGLQTERRWPNS